MLVGQVIGQALGGLQGGNTGALIGVFAGLLFGTYSVYVTAQRLQEAEERSRIRRRYVPPIEEILEEPEFLREPKPEEE